MIGILCFGDSITYGEGDNEGGWCGRLKKWFEEQDENNGVYNLGVCGDTTKGLLGRIRRESRVRLKFKYPEDKYTLIIAIGINDTKFREEIKLQNQETTPKQFEKNIKKLLKKTKSDKYKTCFIGLTLANEEKVNTRGWGSLFKNEEIEKYNSIIEKECENAKVTFLNMLKLMQTQEYKTMLVDGLHPNNKGYEFMFKEIKGFLEKEKLLP